MHGVDAVSDRPDRATRRLCARSPHRRQGQTAGGGEHASHRARGQLDGHAAIRAREAEPAAEARRVGARWSLRVETAPHRADAREHERGGARLARRRAPAAPPRRGSIARVACARAGRVLLAAHGGQRPPVDTPAHARAHVQCVRHRAGRRSRCPRARAAADAPSERAAQLRREHDRDRPRHGGRHQGGRALGGVRTHGGMHRARGLDALQPPPRPVGVYADRAGPCGAAADERAGVRVERVGARHPQVVR
eukprot:2254489-Prymnesium_polylepis.1